MNNPWRWLDVLFPPRETAKTLQSATDTEWDKTYVPGHKDSTIYLSKFSHPLVQATITEVKFYHNTAAAKLLAQHLVRWNKEQPAAQRLFVPIPLSRECLRSRGHNQVTTVLRQTNGEVAILEGVLIRSRDTTPQTSLKRQERMTNVRGAFAINKKVAAQLPIDVELVLLDDVVTTGATLLAAQTALKDQILPTKRIRTLALAH